MGKLVKPQNSLEVLEQEDTKSQVRQMLGDRANHYIASILVLLSNNTRLKACTPQSVVGVVLQGASLNLSFDPTLAEAYMLPFKGQAVFVPGYKGLIQLALRSGEFIELDAKIVTNRMFRDLRDRLATSTDPNTTIIHFFSSIDFYPELHGGQVYGYVSYFRLKNGFSRVVYWDKARCLAHGQKYSPSCKNGKFSDNSAWVTAEDAMCLKTVIRQLLTYAPKSKEMSGVIQVVEAEDYNNQTEETARTIPKRKGHEDEDLFGSDPIDEGDIIDSLIQEAGIKAQWILDHRENPGIGKHVPVAIGFFEDQKAHFVFHDPKVWLTKLNEAGEQIKADRVSTTKNGKEPVAAETKEQTEEHPTPEELKQMSADVQDIFQQDTDQLEKWKAAVQANDWETIERIYQEAQEAIDIDA